MSSAATAESRELPRALLAYSVAIAVFLLLPPTIKSTVGPPAAFTGQELFDLFTPVVVLPTAWLVLRSGGAPDRSAAVAFAAIAGLWAGAQGIHLAANAIGDAFVAGPARDAFYATAAGELDHFLDEDLGHWAWHAAWALLSVLLLVTAVRSGTFAWPTTSATLTAGVAGVVHGATFAIVTTEGGTAALGIPLSIALLGAAGYRIGRGSRHPILLFLASSSAVTLVADLAWAIVNGGRLVEPCQVLGC
jgi:hypothetical protein